jgi:hypothetical protein
MRGNGGDAAQRADDVSAIDKMLPLHIIEILVELTMSVMTTADCDTRMMSGLWHTSRSSDKMDGIDALVETAATASIIVVANVTFEWITDSAVLTFIWVGWIENKVIDVPSLEKEANSVVQTMYVRRMLTFSGITAVLRPLSLAMNIKHFKFAVRNVDDSMETVSDGASASWLGKSLLAKLQR